MVAWIQQKIQTVLGLAIFLIVVGLLIGLGWWALTHVATVIGIGKAIVGLIVYVIGLGKDAGSAIGNGIASLFG